MHGIRGDAVPTPQCWNAVGSLQRIGMNGGRFALHRADALQTEKAAAAP